MIFDTESLRIKYKDYANIPQKVSLDCKKGLLVRVKRGVYSDDVGKDAPAIANFLYGPSYVSFEYALAFYGLIPEKVTMLTSATFGKGKSKSFHCQGASFSYQDIPSGAFPVGTTVFESESGLPYRIAGREKALCDTLYSKYPVRNYHELEELLFDDLRIDEDELEKLDKAALLELCPLYRSTTLSMFYRYIKKGRANE
jgi:predicted transcriptional regulator of viral defense system